MRQIYLDYAATTPIDGRVIDVMQQCLGCDGVYGNPASNTHQYGWQAKDLVDQARERIAELIGAASREIIFTSGATESNNLAIKGVAESYAHKGKHIITSEVEHKAVLDVCGFLEQKGYEVTYLKPNPSGRVSVEQIKENLREDTILVSIMAVNNELGVIQPVEEIGALCRQHKIFFHVDAAQAVGKIPVDVKAMNIDLLSISAHKLYGPKGMGALYVRRRPKVKLIPLIHGGGHEEGYRSGTLPTHQIVGLGKACELAQSEMSENVAMFNKFRQIIQSETQKLSKVWVNGDEMHQFPGIMNITVEGVDGEALIMALHPFAISAGSACNSATIEPSHVLQAIRLTTAQAHASIRVSFGRYTTLDNIEYFVQTFMREVEKLRRLSPIWNDVEVKDNV